MFWAASLSAPLFGTARRSMFGSSSSLMVDGTPGRARGALEMLVHLVEPDALGDHEHLHVVEELGDLLRRPVVRLVLGGHPALGGLLDDLLADGMHAGVERGHGARARRPGTRLV